MFNLSKAKIFLSACLAFIVGVGLRSFFAVPLEWIYAAGLTGLSAVLFFWRDKRWRLIGFCFLFCAFGILRYQASLPRIDDQQISFYNGREVVFIGMVATEPDTRQDHVKLTIAARQMRDSGIQLDGKILAKTYLYPEYHYGDLLVVSCQLIAPEPIDFDTETGVRTFYYDKYLARYGIYSVCYRPSLELIEKDYGNAVMTILLRIKNSFMKSVQRVLPEPHASFLGGLILGAKKSIPDDLMESFSRTGTTHIVALSGYNITIIAVLIMNLCRHLWISRKKSFWVSLVAITFFVLITGAQASVVRAGIMGLLVLLATQLGRMSRIGNTLALAAVVMLLINPKVLVFDTGFQLSFLATIGLVYLSSGLGRLLRWLPTYFGIRENLTATLSATIMTLPLILFQFGRLSLVAPLANVLILPAIPIAMASGFVAGVAAFVWPPLGSAFGFVVWTVLSYIISVVELFARFDFAFLAIGRFGWPWLAAGYLFLGGILLIINKNKFRYA